MEKEEIGERDAKPREDDKKTKTVKQLKEGEKKEKNGTITTD